MSELLVDRQGHTTIFTINRPQKMNSLSREVSSTLIEGLQEFQADPSQYVAILTGSGERAFCTGADLSEMANNASSGRRMPISDKPDPMGLASCEKVTIAAVNGLAVAGGLELAISCDLRIAAPDAWFGVFEAKHGIIAGVATQVLPRMVPIGVAMDMILTGERLSAERAYDVGLVQAVVPRERLLEVALAKAEAVAKLSQAAVWGAKKIISFWRTALIAEQQRYYEAVIHRVLLTGDVHEGPRAFVEKREPVFRNSWPDPFATA
jgi:enoyl-CoA hydratase/carnithine racemase